jgi:hypothetical protein
MPPNPINRNGTLISRDAIEVVPGVSEHAPGNALRGERRCRRLRSIRDVVEVLLDEGRDSAGRRERDHRGIDGLITQSHHDVVATRRGPSRRPDHAVDGIGGLEGE